MARGVAFIVAWMCVCGATMDVEAVTPLPKLPPYSDARCYDVVVERSRDPACDGLYRMQPGSQPRHFDHTSPRKASSIRFSDDGTTAWLSCEPARGGDTRQLASFQAAVKYSGVVPRRGWRAVHGAASADTSASAGGAGTTGEALSVRLGGRCESDCPPCAEGEFEAKACVFGVERVCKPCSVCAEGQATLMPCSPGFDTVCEGGSLLGGKPSDTAANARAARRATDGGPPSTHGAPMPGGAGGAASAAGDEEFDEAELAANEEFDEAELAANEEFDEAELAAMGLLQRMPADLRAKVASGQPVRLHEVLEHGRAA